MAFHHSRIRHSTGSIIDRQNFYHEIVKRILDCHDDNYCGILQVNETASVQEICEAYKKLILMVHPDKNPSQGANEATQKLNAAYKSLSEIRQTRNVYIYTFENEQLFQTNTQPTYTRSNPEFYEFNRSQPSQEPSSPQDNFMHFMNSGGLYCQIIKKIIFIIIVLIAIAEIMHIIYVVYYFIASL